MTMTRINVSFLTLAALVGSTYGFAPSSRNSGVDLTQNKRVKAADKIGTDTAKATTSSTTSLRVFSRAEDLSRLKNIPIGEAQRPFRRTVYTHDDWKKHRSQDRFFYYLLAIFKSGVYKNLAKEVLSTSFIATFIVVFNAMACGYTDFSGVEHAAVMPFDKIGLPMELFTLTSPSLGLLLVFRTNSSYKRWDEARKNWGMNINHTRDLVRMANAYYDSTNATPEQRKSDLDHVALCTWTFVRAMKRHLSPEEEDEASFKLEMYEKLPKQQADKIIKAAHRPNRALQDLSFAIEDLPMHYIRKHEIQAAVTIFEDNLGSSERILTSPVPLFYTRHLARYLSVWLLCLPFGLYDSYAGSWNHITLIPAIAIISTFLFGIEEIGTQLEEPFTVLPMQVYCDRIYNWCTEIMSWSPGDNGMVVRPVQPRHAFFTDGPSYSSSHRVNNSPISHSSVIPVVSPPAPTQTVPINNNNFTDVNGSRYNVMDQDASVSNNLDEEPTLLNTPPQPIDYRDLNAQWAAASKGQRKNL